VDWMATAGGAVETSRTEAAVESGRWTVSD
jgi:hypothetical protein